MRRVTMKGMSSRRDIDEQVVRDRRDPRREETIPPDRRTSDQPAPYASAGSSIPVPELTALAPTSSPNEEPVPRSKPDFTTTLGSGGGRPMISGAHGTIITNVDPRLGEIEPSLRAGDWDAVLTKLGPADQAGKLPPTLGLIYALARKEKEASGKVEGKIDATELAIRCTAGLLGVANDSALALVIAKRLVRSNPIAWQKRPAPPASVSAIIILIALVLGSLVGWLAATGRLHVRLRW